MSISRWQETLITSQVDGSALTAAAAASMLPAAAKYTFPANFFDVVGKALRITASGRISNANPTPGTARYDVRLGGTVVFDSQAMLLDTAAAHTNEAWFLDIILTCRVIGATGNFFGQGIWCADNLKNVGTMPVGGLVAPLPWSGTAPAVGSNVDTTTALQLDVFFTQTVATGSMTCHQFHLQTVN